MVLVVRLEQHDTTSFLVAEQGDGVVGLLLQIAEADDVAERLHRVQNAVRTRVGLEQPVRPQVLVDPQRVERGGIEPGEEHVDHDHQVDLASLQPQREVLVVVLEAVGRGVEAGAEHLVVVLDRVLQEAARIDPERGRVEVLLAQQAVGVIFVCGIAEDDPDLQALVGGDVLLLQEELVVVALGGVDRGSREQCVEAAHPLVLQLIGVRPLRLLVEVFTDVLDHLAQTFGRQQRLLGIDGADLLVRDAVGHLDRVDVVDPERQHVLVRDRVDDGVGVQPVTEGLLSGAPLRVAAAG